MSPSKGMLYTRLKVLLLLKNRRRKRQWVRPINKDRARESEFFRLVKDMKTNDPDAFFTYMRMNPTTFDELLEELRPHIERQSTNMREPISAEERLAVTLR